MPNNEFDQFIKGKLEDASVEAPAFMWNRIEQKLPPVLPWYSKYKYLILLLGLGFTSSSSIFIYKHFYLANTHSNTIALNKRLLKDESNAQKNIVVTDDNNVTANSSATTSTNNNSVDNNNTSSNNNGGKNNSTVASFYNNSSNTVDKTNKNNSTTNTIAKAIEKREARLKRFEVKPTVDNSITLADNSSTTTNTTNSVNTLNTTVAVNSPNRKKVKKAINGSNIVTDKHTILASNITTPNTVAAQSENSNISKDNVEASKSEIANNIIGNTNTEDAQSENINNTVATTDDVTIPIVEPINSTNSDALTASIVPVKENITPLSSREALRAMIEKDKLETLDISSQAAGVTDLNPNKEKILKNLKQFAGYSINRGFHVGAFIAINNVWLNKKQYSADENTSSIKPKVQFGKAYGINIGYDYTDRLGVELEWQISEQGQKYNVGLLSDNNKHTKDISLLYTKFPILFKYRQTFLNNYNSKPISVSFLVGPQFSFLIKQDVKLDGVKVNNAPQYNKLEFGLNGGFDFDLYMMRYMYLTIGARTGFGSSFKKGQPMSFQLGVTTQLNFRYAKKLK